MRLIFSSSGPKKPVVHPLEKGDLCMALPLEHRRADDEPDRTFLATVVDYKKKMVVFFDENHARSIGLRPNVLKTVFFTLLAASTVAALQTVGAFLVIAMVVTPGATAYLLTDRFPRLIVIAVAIGTLTSFIGAYASFYLDGATGGVIVVLQMLVFIAAFLFAPRHGYFAGRRAARLEHEAAR